MTAATSRDVRFTFGRNWLSYAEHLDPQTLRVAEKSLADKLGDITDHSFLDIGSGSGLFSAAARRLGAEVLSFDFDIDSVRCTERTRARFAPEDPHWHVEYGSVLDRDFMAGLGEFDVVYAWGVLHHTGRMWDALGLACERVKPGGRLFVSLYNDQGRASRYWRAVKRAYNIIPARLRPMLVVVVLTKWVLNLALGDIAKHQNPLARYRNYGVSSRGMSVWHDLIDWIGGYPFEVARPGDVFEFVSGSGFEMVSMLTSPDIGCNEYVARRREGRAAVSQPRTDKRDARLTVSEGQAPCAASRTEL